MPIVRAILVAALLTGLAACGGDDDKSDGASSSTTTTVAPPMKLALTVTDTSLDGPAETKAGVHEVTLQNGGTAPWQVNFAKLAPGKTVKDVTDFDAAHKDDENAGPPGFIKLSGAASAEAGRSGRYTVVLTEGSWALAAFGEGDKLVPQYKELKVTAGDADAKLPATDARIEATEFKYNIIGLKAGRNPVTLRNTGGVAHIFVVSGLKRDAKFDDVLAFEGKGDAPGTTTGFQRDLAYLDAGQSGITELDLPAGKYGIACFLNSPPNDPKGKPHFQLGMKQEFTIA